MTAAEMLDRIVPFKRATYDAVVEEFRDLVNSEARTAGVPPAHES